MAHLLKRKLFELQLSLFLLPLIFLSPPLTAQSTDSLLFDFNILKTSLLQNHPALYSYNSHSTIDSLIFGAEAEIKKGQTPVDFYMTVSRLLADIGCGHTYARPSASLQNEISHQGKLPFGICIIDSNIFIRNDLLDSAHQFTGSRIVSINQVPSAVILKRMYSIISSDGTQNTGWKNGIIEKKFDFYIQLLFHMPLNLNFEIETKSGQLQNRSITVPTKINFTSEDFVISPANEADWQEDSLSFPLGNKPVALLRISNFDEGKGIIKKAFREIEHRNINTLIVDLRNNIGGSENIASLLLAYLVDSAFTTSLQTKMHPLIYKKYFSSSGGLVLSTGFKTIDKDTKSLSVPHSVKQRHHFKGKLFVFINSKTFSSGSFAASMLAHKTNATIIGTETGGADYGNSGAVIKVLNLPYSHLQIKFPFYQIINGTTNSNTGRGVLPHQEIKSQLNDILANTDLEWQRFLELYNK